MTVDPLSLMTEVDRATERLLRTAATLDDSALAAPSPLPGWTRGHVLSHLSRNADSLVNLLTWARTGVATPQYPSWEVRQEGIAAGAGRPLAEQLADVRGSASRFAAAAGSMPAEAWAGVVETAAGGPKPAAYVVWSRLREVEVHHVDLDAGYTPDDWPAAFGHRLLREVATGFADRADAPAMTLAPTDSAHRFRTGDATDKPVVSGTAAALAGWLIGRSAGEDLTVTPTGPLPTPPNWI